MAEWLIEAGIGETRGALVEDGQIVEARIEREGEGPRLGAIFDARLVEPARVEIDGPGKPIATIAPPPALPLGSRVRVEISRMRLAERGRDKPPRARLVDSDSPLTPGAGLRERAEASGHGIIDCTMSGGDRLEEAGWTDLIDKVMAGHWPFAGGALWIDPTPAMLLIDIDGDGDPLALAMAGARAAAAMISCCDVGGSIGIDFPSLPGRAERLAIGQLIDELLPQPFERTAVNGFGFLQIIRRRDRPSLIEQLRLDPVARDAALLLRQAERAVGTGVLELVTRPAVADRLAAHPDWIAELQRRTARQVRIGADPMIRGPGHAQ